MIKALFLLTLCLFFMSPNKVSAQVELQETFDRLEYALAVEWDQRDLDFYNQVRLEFEQNLHALTEQGLSTIELIKYVSSGVVDAQKSRFIHEALEFIAVERMNEVQAHQFIEKVFFERAANGASWNGRIPPVGTVFLIVILTTSFITNLSGN